MAAKRGKPTISETVRDALRERNESLRSVARATGVPHCSLVRFLAGKCLRSDSLDRVAEHFGVEVRPPRRGSRKRAKKGG